MPRLNDLGEMTEGRQVHWYDQPGPRTIFQKCEGGRCRVVLSDGTLIADRGAGSLVGQNGRWAAWLDGYGAYDSYGNRFEASSIAETRMSEDGWYVRKVAYQGAGPWVLQKGVEWIDLDAEPDYGWVHVLSGPRAVWAEAGHLRAFGVALEETRRLWSPVAIDVGSQALLLYQDQATAQLVLAGRVIAPPGDYFHLDARHVDGRVVVAWSPNAGDVACRRKAIAPEDLSLYPLIGQEKPMATDRFWLSPCIGSVDMVRIFDDPAATLDGVYAYAMVTENVLDLGTAIGPNTFEALQANHAFQKLQQAGVKLAIEGGPNLGDLEAVDKIRGVKGDVAFSSVSEPLADLYLHPAPGKTLDAVVAKVVEFTRAAEAKGLAVGWLEGFPSVRVEQYRPYLEKLRAQGVRPAYLHLDVDRRHAGELGLSWTSAVKALRALADEYGIPFGVLLWGYDNKDEASYKADARKFAQDAYAALPAMQHVCVASWAIRTTNKKQELPNNLGANGLLELFDVVAALFSATAPIPAPDPHPPDPTPDPGQGGSMFATLIDPLKETLAVKAVKPVAGAPGWFTLILADFVDASGTLRQDKVFSQQPHGEPGDGQQWWREPGADGGYERCLVSGDKATFDLQWTEGGKAQRRYVARFFTRVA